MTVIDKVKTTLITEWGTFCYKVMLFILKNAYATYQRAMTKVFKDMIHKEMEVYIDDMVVRSETFEEYYRDLEKFMERLTKFNVRLNPQNVFLQYLHASY